ncbi:hypothetical protein [Pseudomonas coronafaciens]|uniref:hypothetical protein n=1 Tax=Pseudomonas coronafaciens TaxID=53409 RepID=UPI000F009300|nr:hypothetical protein [Pseudomonas coronafaciens]
MRTTWLERISVGFSVVCLVWGIWFGYTGDPTWLNRCGSLIIVTGVAVASFKLGDILHLQIKDFIEKNEAAQLEQLYDAYEKFWGGPLDKQFKEKLTIAVREKTERTFSDYITRRVDRVKKVEISLLILGTLINGFGDWAIIIAQDALVEQL